MFVVDCSVSVLSRLEQGLPCLVASSLNKVVHVGVCTCLVIVQPAASLYSASPLKQHATGRQGWPNPCHNTDPEPASRLTR